MQKVMFVLASIFVLPGSVFAQGNWIAFTSHAVGTPPIVEVLESSNLRTVIRVTIPGMWVEDTLINGTTYHILRIPDYGTMYNAGEPQLPAIRELIAIPSISNANISVTSTATPLILNGYMVYPYQTPVQEGQQPGPFVIDTILYATNVFYPTNVDELGDPAVWRDVRVVQSTLYPITFNPANHQLNVCFDFTVVLNYWGVSNTNTLPGGYPVGVGPEYASMYRSQIINYDWLDLDEGKQYCDFAYLVITTNEYNDAIQPLVFWKHKKGFETEVEIVAAGSSPDVIKNMIEVDYEERGTEWVLLVGDHPNDIKIKQTNYGYSDYWYTLLTDDDYPELAIGRFSPSTETDVTTMVNKTFAYERVPYSGWDVDEVLLVVAWNCYDSYRCKKYIGTEVMAAVNFKADTAYAADTTKTYQYADNDTVEHYIQEDGGVNIVNYRGHGSDTRWQSEWHGTVGWSSANEYFTTSDVRNLSNYWYPDSARLPLVFNFCCSTGDITHWSECLVEAWTRADSGGAVGSLGATGETYWPVSNAMDTVLFEVMFPSVSTIDTAIYDIGKAINYAKVWVINNPPCVGDSTLKVVYRHLWAGDPSLWVWTDSTGNPATLTVTHPTRIETQPTQFTVTVEDGVGGANIPIQGALVCLYKESDIYTKGFTDKNGQVTFNIEPTTAGTLHVTVTNHHYVANYYYNYRPYEGTCRVLQSDGGPMSHNYSSVIPKVFALGHSYPNPFKQNTEIKYQIPETRSKPWVCLKAYNATGRLVRTLVNEPQNPGYYKVLWDGKDDFGKRVSSGVYFYYLEAGDFTAMRKIVVMQ